MIKHSLAHLIRETLCLSHSSGDRSDPRSATSQRPQSRRRSQPDCNARAKCPSRNNCGAVLCSFDVKMECRSATTGTTAPFHTDASSAVKRLSFSLFSLSSLGASKDSFQQPLSRFFSPLKAAGLFLGS